MNYLYLITEDDNDDLFFEACLERITGLTFTTDNTRRRMRQGGGISAVRHALARLLKDIQRTGIVEDVYLVVAIDNDRAPQHPEHMSIGGLSKFDQKKPCRICELQRTIESVLGHDSSSWPVKIAIAVPVQMLESWLLVIRGHQSNTLPIFPEKTQTSALKFYNSKRIPEQLKDLCQIEIQKKASESMAEFCLECATDLLDPDDLAQKSPSFAHFKEQIENWS